MAKGKRKAKRKARTAIVTRSAAPTVAIVRTSSGGPMVKKQKRRPARRHGGAIGAGRSGLKRRGWQAAGGAFLGYLSSQETDTYAKIPTAAGLPVEVTIALGAHLLAKGRGGIADDIATAASAIAGYKLGRANFKLADIQVAGHDHVPFDDE